MLPFGLDKPEPVTGPLFAMLFDCGREVSHSAPMIRIAHEDQFLRPESFLPLKAKSKFELTEHQHAWPLRVLQIADYVKATPDYVSSNSTARAEPGVKWSEFDRVIQAFGSATTRGTDPDNGIAGLTLRGGIGLESAHTFTSLPEGAVP